MEQLSALDAAFLETEDSDQHVSLAVGGVSVIEGPMPDYDAIVAVLAERVSTVPRFRQVLRTHFLDLSTPEWVDDSNFDPYRHIHWAALPHGGDDEALHRFVADVMERRLDRDHSLWECWVVEGLAGGHWALIMKIHHCIADGIATMQLFDGLSDGGSAETFANEIRAAKETAKSRDGRSSISLNPVDWVRGMWSIATCVTGVAALALGGAVEVTAGILNPAAESSLNGPVGAMRRYSSAQVSLSDVRTVCCAFDVTLNDVALAAITQSYRAALIRRGDEPRHTSMRTLVPVSTRGTNSLGIPDNRVSLMLPFLPVDKNDPVDQLRCVHRRLTRAKAAGQREAGSIFVNALDVVPFAVTAWAVRLLTRLRQRGVVTVATNVPGPREHRRILGREVIRMLPVPPIALQLRTGIAILSYGNDLAFGITADYETAPDVDELARGIEEAIGRLVGYAADMRGPSALQPCESAS
jgi:diacylglycerol O-acyltransferase